MNLSISATRIDAAAADWPNQLRAMRRQLAERPSLLPHHFLEVVLPKIGGALFALWRKQTNAEMSLSGYAFLLPRDISDLGAEYTLRYEQVDGAPNSDAVEITQAVEQTLPSGDRAVFYQPDAAHRFTPTHIEADGVDCGNPDAAEAEAIRAMQQSIWHSPPDGLYPSDLHSDDAGSGSSLVARVDGDLAGFLLGFYRFGPTAPALPPYIDGQALRLESQLLAVAPGRRGRRIGQLLKRLQARQALAAGIDLISWTTDPLLFPNALLNFTRLRALAYEFQPSLYSFRNELNRVPASRLNILWPIGSRRVQQTLANAGRADLSRIEADPNLTIVNRADNSPVFDSASARIALEIPADWVALQRADQTVAQRWRDVTNRLLEHYLGAQPGQYIITNAAVSGSRRYLIGERVDGRLLEEKFARTD